MDKNISFKQYYESRMQLFEAAKSIPVSTEYYYCRKYCKVPIIESDDKSYISLKPRDVIKVVSESNGRGGNIRSMVFRTDDGEYKAIPDWKLEKIWDWLDKNAMVIVDPLYK